MPKELKSYSINGHAVVLLLDNVCGNPFFVVRLDGRETFAGLDRSAAVIAFDAACGTAGKEAANG